MIRVQHAGTSDTEMLATLGRRAFYEAFSAFNDPGDMQAYLDLSFNAENIRRQLADPTITYLVAFDHDLPVGYAKLKRESNPPELAGKPCMQLERIYALQDFIGRKVGKSLMEACLEIVKREQIRYLWLGVWQQNERAISFYRKWHFKIIGFKQFVIGKEVNDDYVMALDVEGDSLSEIDIPGNRL